MSNGYEPIFRQLTYVPKTNTLYVTIPGRQGDVSNWSYRIRVIDANGNLPSVDATATPSSGNILATSNAFVTPASNNSVSVEFVFTTMLPDGYTEVIAEIVTGFSVP